MKSIVRWLGFPFLFCLALTSCSKENTQVPSFDGNRAFEYLVKQVEFGPRVPGSVYSTQCRNYFYDHFKNANVPVDSQHFEFTDPYSGTKLQLVNVIASVRGEKSTEPGLVLMAHYDSRPRTDFPSSPALANHPVAGANDGASGAAILMELANLLGEKTPPGKVDLVLVDGEDWGESGDNDYYLLGSREFARRGIRGKYRFGIVIDMVGDSSQQIYREVFSQDFHSDLNDMVWETAKKLGIDTFIDSTVHVVLDDHVSLASSGVPAIDLIDFDYKYWHSDSDIVSKCSASSLENVGRVLTYICYNPTVWPKTK